MLLEDLSFEELENELSYQEHRLADIMQDAEDARDEIMAVKEEIEKRENDDNYE